MVTRSYFKPVPAKVKARQKRICLLCSKLREAERSLQRAATRYVRAEKALEKARRA